MTAAARPPAAVARMRASRAERILRIRTSSARQAQAFKLPASVKGRRMPTARPVPEPAWGRIIHSELWHARGISGQERIFSTHGKRFVILRVFVSSCLRVFVVKRSAAADFGIEAVDEEI